MEEFSVYSFFFLRHVPKKLYLNIHFVWGFGGSDPQLKDENQLIFSPTKRWENARNKPSNSVMSPKMFSGVANVCQHLPWICFFGVVFLNPMGSM